ncbi:hypothetical protein [robinz microvirus RP_109]|nr:hypothetical protein [robinz microvirus RP_109]
MNEQNWYKFSYEFAQANGQLGKGTVVYAGANEAEATGKAKDALLKTYKLGVAILLVREWKPIQMDFVGRDAGLKGK